MDQLAPFLLNLRRKETPPLKALGRHLLTECYGCDRAILNDVEQGKQAIEAANPLPVERQASLFDRGQHEQALTW